MTELSFRDGRASDLQAVFELGEVAWDASAAEKGGWPSFMKKEIRRASCRERVCNDV